MAFFKKLSDNFLSFVSPKKQDATQSLARTPQTVPRVRPAAKTAAAPTRRATSIGDAVKGSRSMSPVSRVDSWRVGPSSQTTRTIPRGSKRKRPITPSSERRGPGRPRKSPKLEASGLAYTLEMEEDMDVDMDAKEEEEEDYSEDDEDDRASRARRTRSRSRSSSRSTKGYAYPSDSDLEDTLVISEEEYTRISPKSRKIISPTKEQFSRGVTTEELRAQGWDDDHITLVQKIAMRGFEPLMPLYWKFKYDFMPDSLFAADDNAFISSVRGEQYRSIMALEKLLELGGRVRDRVLLQKRINGRVPPEEQTRRMLNAYMKWANEDCGLDKKTALPLLTMEIKPNNTPATELTENARRKLARLASRYREAFRVKQSIESSPTSRTSTVLSDPIPTLYCIIASHTLIALTAYNPNEGADAQVKSVAFFEMRDRDYDVWNALALAIIVCHVRNVRLRIVEETGIGFDEVRDVGEEDDPDA